MKVCHLQSSLPSREIIADSIESVWSIETLVRQILTQPKVILVNVADSGVPILC